MNVTSRMSASLDDTVDGVVDNIKHQLEGRAYKAANELRNASQLVLRGSRSGRVYTVPGTKRKYTASGPGEPPANRTGTFRMSWQASSHVVYGSYISRIESNVRTDNGRYNLGSVLEEGTSRMAPRPYVDQILERAEPEIVKIYAEDY